MVYRYNNTNALIQWLQDTLADANQKEPFTDELTSASEELQKELDTRPEAKSLAQKTADVTGGFKKSQTDLADLITWLVEYSDVAEKFTKSYDDLAEWLPTVQRQATELQPISTQPDVVEEQIQETEVSACRMI